MSQHEKVVGALEHLNREREARPGIPLVQLVDEAARHFDLDALQSETLLRTAMRLPAAGGECPTCGGTLQATEAMDGHLVCGSGHLFSRPGAR